MENDQMHDTKFSDLEVNLNAQLLSRNQSEIALAFGRLLVDHLPIAEAYSKQGNISELRDVIGHIVGYLEECPIITFSGRHESQGTPCHLDNTDFLSGSASTIIIALNRLGMIAFKAEQLDNAANIFGHLHHAGQLSESNALHYTETLIRLERFKDAEDVAMQTVEQLSSMISSLQSSSSAAPPSDTNELPLLGNKGEMKVNPRQIKGFHPKTVAAAAALLAMTLGNLAIAQIALERSDVVVMATYSKALEIAENHLGAAHPITRQTRDEITLLKRQKQILPRINQTTHKASTSMQHRSSFSADEKGTASLILPPLIPHPPPSPSSSHPPHSVSQPNHPNHHWESLLPSPAAFFPPKPPSQPNPSLITGTITTPASARPRVMTPDSLFQSPLRPTFPITSPLAPRPPIVTSSTPACLPDSANSTAGLGTRTLSSTAMRLPGIFTLPKDENTEESWRNKQAMERFSMLVFESKARGSILDEEETLRRDLQSIQQLGCWRDLSRGRTPIPLTLFPAYHYCHQLLFLHHEHWERQVIDLESMKAMLACKEWLYRHWIVYLQKVAWQELRSEFMIQTKWALETSMDFVKQRSQVVREELTERGMIGTAQLQARGAFPSLWAIGLLEVSRREEINVESRARHRVLWNESEDRKRMIRQSMDSKQFAIRLQIKQREDEEMEMIKAEEYMNRKVTELHDIDHHALRAFVTIAERQCHSIVHYENRIRSCLMHEFLNHRSRIQLSCQEQLTRSTFLHEYRSETEVFEREKVYPFRNWWRQLFAAIQDLWILEQNERLEFLQMERHYRLTSIEVLAICNLESVARRTLWSSMMDQDLLLHHSFQRGWLIISANETEQHALETEERSRRMEIVADEIGSHTFIVELHRLEGHSARLAHCEGQEKRRRNSIMENEMLEWTQIQSLSQLKWQQAVTISGLSKVVDAKEAEMRRGIEGTYHHELVSLWNTATNMSQVLNPRTTTKAPIFQTPQSTMKTMKAKFEPFMINDVCTV